MMIDELKHVMSMLIELYSLFNHDVAKLNFYNFLEKKSYFVYQIVNVLSQCVSDDLDSI